MEEIIILFFQVAWYAIWCVGLYTTVRWVGTRKVVKRMWNMLHGRNLVVYALIAVAVISIILTPTREQETMEDLPQPRYEWPGPFDLGV